MPGSIWSPEDVGFVRNGKEEVRRLVPDVEPFSTPKARTAAAPHHSIATDPGDIVLDPFVGSGTTAAVAHKMGRRWVAIEREAATLDTFALPRLTNVVGGHDSGGATEVTGWRAAVAFASWMSHRPCSRRRAALSSSPIG